MSIEYNRDKRLNCLLNEFELSKCNYDEFEQCLNNLIGQIVKRTKVIPHDISSRRKATKSFSEKISKPGKIYDSISDITDIVGVRITTYFESEVDQIKEIIIKEFDIDERNSIDKRKLHDPDRFGYMSLHYVVSLKTDRLKFPEYIGFSGLKAEIQIRSILQHTWAEIEHDLGYKSKYAVPRDLKRRFSQLASLLELADREFLEIRKKIGKYEQRVLECLEKTDNEITVNKNSIIIVTEHDKRIIELDEKICKITKAKLTGNHDFSENVANMLLWLDIGTISELIIFVDLHKEKITSFADVWIKQKGYKEFNHGVSVMYTCYMILAEQNSEERINHFADTFNLGGHVDNFGEYLIKTYNKIYEVEA